MTRELTFFNYAGISVGSFNRAAYVLDIREIFLNYVIYNFVFLFCLGSTSTFWIIDLPNWFSNFIFFLCFFLCFFTLLSGRFSQFFSLNCCIRFSISFLMLLFPRALSLFLFFPPLNDSLICPLLSWMKYLYFSEVINNTFLKICFPPPWYLLSSKILYLFIYLGFCVSC